MQQVRVGWPAPRCTSCRCSCHSSAFALTFPHFCGPHVGSVPHSTHGSTSQCLAAHCTFALSPRLLLAPCSHARHPRSRSVSVAHQHQRFGNSHQARTGNLTATRPLPPFREAKVSPWTQTPWMDSHSPWMDSQIHGVSPWRPPVVVRQGSRWGRTITTVDDRWILFSSLEASPKHQD